MVSLPAHTPMIPVVLVEQLECTTDTFCVGQFQIMKIQIPLKRVLQKHLLVPQEEYGRHGVPALVMTLAVSVVH